MGLAPLAWVMGVSGRPGFKCSLSTHGLGLQQPVWCLTSLGLSFLSWKMDFYLSRTSWGPLTQGCGRYAR